MQWFLVRRAANRRLRCGFRNQRIIPAAVLDCAAFGVGAAFKNRFGDWEKIAYKEKIEALNPKRVTPSYAEITPEIIETVVKDWENTTSPDGFKTILPKETIKKIRSHQGFSVAMILQDIKPLFEISMPLISSNTKGEYTDGAGGFHKNKPNIGIYKNYVNKFSFLQNGKEQTYYIRFTSQVENRSKKTPQHQMHSTAISKIEIYNASPPTPSSIIQLGRVHITQSDRNTDPKSK